MKKQAEQNEDYVLQQLAVVKPKQKVKPLWMMGRRGLHSESWRWRKRMPMQKDQNLSARETSVILPAAEQEGGRVAQQVSRCSSNSAAFSRPVLGCSVLPGYKGRRQWRTAGESCRQGGSAGSAQGSRGAESCLKWRVKDAGG